MSAIHTEYTITNKKSGASFKINDHVTDPDNLIALQAFPTFALDMRANDIPLTSHHGAYKLPHFYGGRSIIFNGVIFGQSEANVWNLKKQIDTTLQLGVGSEYDELVNITFTDPTGTEFTVDATLNASVSYSKNMQEPFTLNFQILLRARSPYLFINDDVFDLTIYTGNLGGEVSNFTIPFTIPFFLNSTTTGTLEITVTEKTKSIITLYGSDDEPIKNPVIKNITTGKITEFDYTIPKGSNNFIKINSLTGEIKDQDGIKLEVYVKNGGFIELQKGLNKLRYTSNKNEDGSYPTALFKVTGKQYTL